MELKDTVDGMLSKDYKERFKAEYDQLVIRRVKLTEILDADADGTLGFELTCPRRVLEEQELLMRRLMFTMEERARCEGIDLWTYTDR